MSRAALAEAASHGTIDTRAARIADLLAGVVERHTAEHPRGTPAADT